jgi:thiol-disulfide isomerase/thioredoxin
MDLRGGMTPGEVAPPIKAAGWLNGAPPDLEGKVVVIELWATWCKPCRQFAPEMVKLHSKYRDKGVVFVGLSVEDEEALPEMQRWVSDLDITWPNGYGAEETIQQLRMESIPVFWVIGSDGKVTWNVDSSLSPEEAIEEALKNAKSKSG